MPADLTLPLADLPDPLPIPTISAGARPFDAVVRPPGSKSITNRALLLAALADGTSTLRGALTDADDARVMLRAVERLGAGVDSPAGAETGALRITGVKGRWRIPPGQTVRLDLHNAGTATRFLTAAALLAPAGTSVVVDGDARMRERPIEELVRFLNNLTDPHACAAYEGEPGFPPVRITPGHTAWVSGTLQVFGRTQSSQFISAILLLAPFLPHGLNYTFSTPDVTSRSYVEMTRGLLARVGVRLTAGARGEQIIHPVTPSLPAFDLDVEPDASGATYFEAAGALVPGARVTIPGLDLGPRGSLQGDTRFVRVLTEMGARVERVGVGKTAGLRITGADRLNPIDADLSDMPDTAMTAAVLCCFAGPTPDNPSATSTLRGLRTLRVKETDRLAALQTELTRFDARVEIVREGDDEGLRITPPPSPSSGSRATGAVSTVTFDTYNDHRMAMALALIGLRVPGVRINNPACVAKTYPGYWKDLAALYD